MPVNDGCGHVCFSLNLLPKFRVRFGCRFCFQPVAFQLDRGFDPGYVFGRGNQQIGPAAIRAVGLANLVVVASERKLLSLDGPLRLDTGDPELDAQLAGHIRVRVAPGFDPATLRQLLAVLEEVPPC